MKLKDVMTVVLAIVIFWILFCKPFGGLYWIFILYIHQLMGAS